MDEAVVSFLVEFGVDLLGGVLEAWLEGLTSGERRVVKPSTHLESL